MKFCVFLLCLLATTAFAYKITVNDGEGSCDDGAEIDTLLSDDDDGESDALLLAALEEDDDDDDDDDDSLLDMIDDDTDLGEVLDDDSLDDMSSSDLVDMSDDLRLLGNVLAQRKETEAAQALTKAADTIDTMVSDALKEVMEGQDKEIDEADAENKQVIEEAAKEVAEELSEEESEEEKLEEELTKEEESEQEAPKRDADRMTTGKPVTTEAVPETST